MLEQRLDEELALLQTRYPHAKRNGRWFYVPGYPTGAGWNVATTDVALLAHEAHPGTAPYGIYVPVGIKFNGSIPGNYSEPAPHQPPFGGSWGIFSWEPVEGQWRATADPRKGANVLNFVLGIAERFRAGA